MYDRKDLYDIRVTAKGYIDREIFDREPKRYLSRKDVYLERKGIRTIRGNENRAIEMRDHELREQERLRNRGRSR